MNPGDEMDLNGAPDRMTDCFNEMIEYKIRVQQIERNQRLLILLEQYFGDSNIETHINLLKSLERAISMQKHKISHKASSRPVEAI